MMTLDAVCINCYKCIMSKLLILCVALSACVDRPIEVQPDAGVDAPVNVYGGCMGSLPKARTATLTSADPFPSALGNELQDMHVGDKRTFFKRQFFPSCWHASGTPPTLVNNPASPTGPDVPVWLVPTAQTIITRIPYYPGEQVSGVSGAGSPGFQIEVYGDGAADFTAVLRSIAGLNTTSGATVIVNDGRTNQAASWSTVNLSVDVEIPLPDPGALYLSIAVSSGTQIYIGQIIPLFTRP